MTVASPQVTGLESMLDALGVQDTSIQQTGGGVLVSFTYNGQVYNLQVSSVGGVTSIRSVSQTGAPGADLLSSSGVTNGPGIIAPCPNCGGGGPTLYLVTFDESGLASGAAWSVAVTGTNYDITSLGTVGGSPPQADLPNGQYSYQAVSSAGTDGYYTNSGSFTVSGATHTVSTTLTSVGDPPSGITTSCWLAILEAFAGSAFTIAAAVACATTGVGCIVLFFMVNFDGLVIPTEVAVDCGI